MNLDLTFAPTVQTQIPITKHLSDTILGLAELRLSQS